MKYTTFQRTGIEVLEVGLHNSESDQWPGEHWRAHPERWRLFSLGIDLFVSEQLQGKDYGGNVAGLLLILEIADFPRWPYGTFVLGEKPCGFHPSVRQIRCTIQFSWPEVGTLTMKQQFALYAETVLAAVDRIQGARRIPKDFSVQRFRDDLAAVFRSARPSHLTRARYLRGLEETPE